MTIYGYARVSTITQVKEDESLDAQKLQIQSYAISKVLELDAANIFVEAGVSGGIEFANRPEGSRLTQLVTTGDIIIFPKLDRAFRNTRNALNVLHEMKERKVSIHFIDLGGDLTGNGIGAIVFTILSAFATFERERIATRIREVKQVQKSQGKFTGGRSPYTPVGYSEVLSNLVPNIQHLILLLLLVFYLVHFYYRFI
jgi:putative DNA-invertase from lambdoid prophage Rac